MELAGLGMKDFREFLAKLLGTNPSVTGTLSGRYRLQVTIHRRLKTDSRGVSTGLVGGQRAQELGTDW
jgi:antitoxin component HigA of HigAB toxin-antitoxin module